MIIVLLFKNVTLFFYEIKVEIFLYYLHINKNEK